METKATQPIKDATLLVEIAEKLLEAQREIDELVLQLALGKAEARDKFEETKEEFRSRLSEFKRTNLGSIVAGTANKLKGSLEELDLQLSLGKADLKDKFVEQKKKIESVIKKVRAEAQALKDELPDREHLEHEIEKFKLKLEVLRLRFELKKFEIKDSFKASMRQARKKIEQTTSKFKDKLGISTSGLDGMRRDAGKIYKRLRKVIKSI